MRRKVKEGGGAVSGVAKDKKRVKSKKSLARHVAGNGSKITGATSSSCDALLSKLNSARFRYISEQLYTKSSEEGMLLFQSDPQSFKAYHKGYGIQMKKWPCQPIIDVIQSLKAECNGGKIVIADMGCGDARIARDLNGKAVVHSFDFMAINEDVVVCDMAKVPLPNGSCDVVVFCLSLMGTNLTDFVFEANRILKVGGRMKIAEITSRFYSIKHFVVALAEFGFDLISKRLKSDGYFIIFNFSKAKEAKKKRNRWLKLKPCVYKKRVFKMSLVELGWRQFTFFDKSTIKDPNNPDEKYSGLKDLKACCCAFGSNFALFGEANGGVLKLTSNLDDYSWMAHKCLLVDIALAENILATVGEDEEGINSLVKLWQLDRVEKGAPFCVRVIRACPLLGSGRCPRACIVALHSSHQHIAIGFDDSSVLYCNGNILKEKSGKWITVANGINVGLRTELTGLALAWLPARNTCVLYCMSTTNIRSFAIAKTVTNTITHDSKGCRRNCWSFNVELNRLTVGSPEMVHFYEAEDSIGESGAIDGKGKCYALGRCNEKIQLLSYESYVILLTRQPITTASADNVFNWVVSIFDIDCQCIAFSCAIPPPAWIVIFDDVVMILGQDGTLASLTEKRLSAKIDILSKKNLFDLAVGLAKRSALGGDYLPDIHRQYGDYLYKSGDFDNAVQQYGETIGSLQPSYVIKKFLNGSLIKELSTYLEVLHSKRKASSHHTTILFNCYTRLRSEEKIRKLIEQDFECDVAVICQMLRTAGFIEAACALCEKSDMVDMLLNIYIEERHDYSSVFKYIEKLDQSLTVEYLEKYGKLLLEKCPDETMDFLSKIINSSASFDANRLMKIFVENVERCSQFVEIVLKVDRDNSKLRNLLFELRLRQKVQDEKEITDSELVSLIGEKDLDDVLQICRMFDFMPGIIHIFTKQKRFDELIEFYLERGNIKEIIELCETKSNPTLWISALSYVSREASVNTETIQLLLEKIERTKSIHPLVVLEILSKSDTICIGHVQDYIIKWLKEQNDLISDDQKQIHEYEQKMASIEEDIEDLNSNIQIFQTNKCSACDTLLQLPAIHFLCKHAYHAHCLESYSEKADYCPACIRNDSRLSGEESSNDELNSKASYKKFQEEISNSIDCIETLAHYVARGVYSSAQDNTNQSKPDRRMTENSLDSRIIGFQDEFPAPASESSLLSPGAALNPFDEVGDTYSTNPFYHP